MYPDITIIKRNGSHEPFELIKISRVVQAAGATQQQANIISEEVLEWIRSIGKQELTTIELRDQVIYKLREVNENAADLYSWYESTKDEKKDQ